MIRLQINPDLLSYLGLFAFVLAIGGMAVAMHFNRADQ